MRAKKTIDVLINKTVEFIGKIYPVLFSEGFNLSQANQTASCRGDDAKFKMRQDLITSALGFGRRGKLTSKTPVD